MSETIYKIKKKQSKFKKRLSQLDILFGVEINSLNNKNNKIIKN
tara:strand:- start:628 stop:759 length:132 start_codon:yes stop_codon:yes gene_type:complete